MMHGDNVEEETSRPRRSTVQSTVKGESTDEYEHEETNRRQLRGLDRRSKNQDKKDDKEMSNAMEQQKGMR